MDPVPQPGAYSCGNCDRYFPDERLAEECCPQRVVQLRERIVARMLYDRGRTKPYSVLWRGKSYRSDDTTELVEQVLRDCGAPGWSVLNHDRCHFAQHYTGRIWNPDVEEMQDYYGTTCREAEDAARRRSGQKVVGNEVREAV